MAEKQIEIIEDLLIEFDEMGFAPTILHPDPEAYAIEWRRKLTEALKGYRKQSEWISVEERLPEHKQLVLGYIVDERIGEQTIAAVECRYQELDTWYFPPLCEWEKVTHWMPLPEPPKKGGAE